MFMRRAAGGDKMNFVEMEPALRGSRDRKVADVNRIKCAAEERNPALPRMTSRSAVALRRGDAQRFSVLESAV
jgi:hypothetical protein